MVTSIQPGSQDTVLTGASIVTVVAAPASGKVRTVVALRLAQLDSAAVTPILYRETSGTPREIDRRVDLAPGETWSPANLDLRLVLAPTQSLRMALTGAHATVAPIAYAEYLESTE